MKIEAGKYYKTRDGRKVGPMVYTSEGWGPGSKWFYVNNQLGSWHADGTPHDKDTDSKYGPLISCVDTLPPSEQPTQGPIREVRRREIVPGQWGNINVNCVVDGNVFINVRDDFGHVAFNAEQLREAAHLFNQLAEVLEEQG